MSNTIKGDDGHIRCQWAGVSPEFMDYHDTEWGYPVVDDIRLFEKICLEGFQSGLSWRTILAKRENFRQAFQQFDFNKVAKFTEHDLEMLLEDKGIIRNRRKIAATIHNAKMVQPIVQEFGSLAIYLWQFAPEPITCAPAQPIATSPASTALSKDLKKRGWKFVGPTTLYAFMQAMGMVNDHAEDCFIRFKVEKIQTTFKKPH